MASEPSDNASEDEEHFDHFTLLLLLENLLEFGCQLIQILAEVRDVVVTEPETGEHAEKLAKLLALGWRLQN